ncbi:MAG: MoxR family ATPase [Candidatus Eremiobacteraeota bacterium]|nr:MoxR family ATPase [Candidatus Eremiobacteraeota bacterium]MBC5827086.1 MoxR family ATPase [Candidatus Eremiobacteraeota bacterium]
MAPSASDVAQRLRSGFAKVVVGQDATIFALLIAMFAQGHALIEGVPGTAKTLIVRALALLLGAEFRRIQFTPDLMPSDVVGTTVFNPKSGEFFTRRGPLFANLVLADEINRTPPKTQSALLEAMEERQVTIDGVSIPLPPLFLVCATQNPVEYEGTYPLPEAQIDRFMVKTTTGYPAPEEELELLARCAEGFDARFLERAGLEAVVSEADVNAARSQVRAVHLAAPLQRYVYDIVAQTRLSPDVGLGASPRAGIALLLGSQAAAAIDGRDFVTPDDVKATAGLILHHRLIVRPEAEVEGITGSDVVSRVLATVPVPEIAVSTPGSQPT